MATAAESSLLFQERPQRIVRDIPKMDLESYISNYDGKNILKPDSQISFGNLDLPTEGITRVLRLQTIAMSSPYLSQEAFRLAIVEAKNGKNVDLYLQLVAYFGKLESGDPLAVLDDTWVDRTTRKVKTETDRLEHELKTYKNNLIKESIRMGQEDLGNHYCAVGDMSNAFKAYSRMREYCTTSKQVAHMYFKLLYVCVFQRNWVIVQSYQLKIQALQISDTERAQFTPIFAACVGLAQLAQSNYREAAIAFLGVDQSYATPEPQANIVFQRQVMTANDVAVYGGLCALAKMDRAELQRRVLDNSSFRPLLELEPHIRRAISMFCASKYTSCLSILESYMADYLLDMYLEDHFINLYRLVRSKCLVQWFSAFSVVTWDEIEKAFPQKLRGMRIEQELESMIKAGELDARLDLLLVSPDPNPRISVITDTIAVAERTERALRLKLHRINMLAAGLVVTAPSTSPLNAVNTTSGGSGLDVGFNKGNGSSNMSGFGGRGGGKVKKGNSGLGGGFANMI